MVSSPAVSVTSPTRGHNIVLSVTRVTRVSYNFYSSNYDSSKNVSKISLKPWFSLLFACELQIFEVFLRSAYDKDMHTKCLCWEFVPSQYLCTISAKRNATPSTLNILASREVRDFFRQNKLFHFKRSTKRVQSGSCILKRLEMASRTREIEIFRIDKKLQKRIEKFSCKINFGYLSFWKS